MALVRHALAAMFRAMLIASARRRLRWLGYRASGSLLRMTTHDRPLLIIRAEADRFKFGRFNGVDIAWERS